MIFIFRNMTIFWDISKWNRGQKKWDRGSRMQAVKEATISNVLVLIISHNNNTVDALILMRIRFELNIVRFYYTFRVRVLLQW